MLHKNQAEEFGPFYCDPQRVILGFGHIKYCFKKINGAIHTRKGRDFHQHVPVSQQIISPLGNALLSGRKLD